MRTGASIMRWPAATASLLRRVDVPGSMVEQSISSDEGGAFSKTPSGPLSTPVIIEEVQKGGKMSMVGSVCECEHVKGNKKS